MKKTLQILISCFSLIILFLIIDVFFLTTKVIGAVWLSKYLFITLILIGLYFIFSKYNKIIIVKIYSLITTFLIFTMLFYFIPPFNISVGFHLDKYIFRPTEKIYNLDNNINIRVENRGFVSCGCIVILEKGIFIKEQRVIINQKECIKSDNIKKCEIKKEKILVYYSDNGVEQIKEVYINK